MLQEQAPSCVPALTPSQSLHKVKDAKVIIEVFQKVFQQLILNNDALRALNDQNPLFLRPELIMTSKILLYVLLPLEIFAYGRRHITVEVTSPLPPHPSVLKILPRGIRVARVQPQPGSFTSSYVSEMSLGTTLEYKECSLTHVIFLRYVILQALPPPPLSVSSPP